MICGLQRGGLFVKQIVNIWLTWKKPRGILKRIKKKMKINFRFWLRAAMCIAFGIVLSDAMKALLYGLVSFVMLILSKGSGGFGV